MIRPGLRLAFFRIVGVHPAPGEVCHGQEPDEVQRQLAEGRCDWGAQGPDRSGLKPFNIPFKRFQKQRFKLRNWHVRTFLNELHLLIHVFTYFCECREAFPDSQQPWCRRAIVPLVWQTAQWHFGHFRCLGAWRNAGDLVMKFSPLWNGGVFF